MPYDGASAHRRLPNANIVISATRAPLRGKRAVRIAIAGAPTTTPTA
jgi:hypothetical protein